MILPPLTIYLFIGYLIGRNSIVGKYRDFSFYLRLLVFLIFWPAIVILALYVGGVREVKRMLGY